MTGNRFEVDGWCYLNPNHDDGSDCRKLVTLTQDGMTWVGIRAFDFARQRWVNNGEPSPSEAVQAWRELPKIAEGFWFSGKLTFPASKDTAP